MVRENNQLHLELIQKGEDLEVSTKRYMLQEKKLSSDLTDKGFVIHHQFQQIRQLERDLAAHKERIERLLDKNFTCIAGPTGDLMPKGQDLHMSQPLSSAKSNAVNEKPVLQVLSDLESETSLQISALQSQVDSFASIREDLELQIDSLARALENREVELQRMGKLLETGINSGSEQIERALEEKDDLIRRLNGQIDFLTSQVLDDGIPRQNKSTGKDFRDKEIEALKSREAELLGMLEAAESENHKLLDAKARGDTSGKEISMERFSNLGALFDEVSRSETRDIGHTTSSSASHENRHSAKSASLNDHDSRLEIECQLLTYQTQVRTMEEALAKSRQLEASYQQKMNEAHAQAEGLRQELQRTKSILRHSATDSDSREDLKQLCDKLTGENASLISQLEDSRRRSDALQDEANEMRRLRDGLAAVVVEFENQLIMVQGNIRDLYSERDAKDVLIQQLTDSLRASEQRMELQEQRQESNNAGVSKIVDSAPSSGRTDKSEGGDVKALGTHTLSERLQASNANVSLLQVQLETALADLRACSSKEQTAARQLKDAQAKCAEKESAIRQLQTLMAHLDETRGDVASRLQGYMEENAGLKEQVRTLGDEVQSLQLELKRRDDDVDRARSAMSTVDGERDSLLLQLENRAEQVQRLETALADAEQRQSQSLAGFMTAQQQADLLRQALGERDGQVRVLQDQLDAECRRRSALESQLALRMEDARNLASDLSIMTRENQVVNTELAALVSQREALKRDLDAAFERLAVAEQLVQGREKERDDVLVSYRALNDEKVRAEASLDRCSSECHQLRAQVRCCGDCTRGAKRPWV